MFSKNKDYTVILVAGFIVLAFCMILIVKSDYFSSSTTVIDENNAITDLTIANTHEKKATLKFPPPAKQNPLDQLLTRIHSPEETQKLKEMNNILLDPQVNPENRKNAINEMLNAWGDDAVPVLLENTQQLGKFKDDGSKEVTSFLSFKLAGYYADKNSEFVKSSEKDEIAETHTQTLEPTSQLSEGSSPEIDTVKDVSLEAVSDEDQAEESASSASSVKLSQKTMKELSMLDMSQKESIEKVTEILMDKEENDVTRLLALTKLKEVEQADSLPVYKKLLEEGITSEHAVLEVTAIKTLYDMGTPGAEAILNELYDTTKDVRIKQSLDYLWRKNN